MNIDMVADVTSVERQQVPTIESGETRIRKVTTSGNENGQDDTVQQEKISRWNAR